MSSGRLSLSSMSTLLTLFLLSSISYAQTCYWPNGDPAPEQTPCNNSALYSSCCYSDSYCLDNGLCLDGYWNLLSAGSCTDKSYDSLTCFQFCKNPTWTWTDLIANYNTTGFCCHFYEDVSDDNDNLCESNLPNNNSTRPVFNPAIGHIITDRTTGSIVMYNSSTPANDSVSSAGAGVSRPTYTPDAGSDSGSGSGDLKKELAIGLGVGLPLLVALMAVAGVAWRERRTLVRERAQWSEKGYAAIPQNGSGGLPAVTHEMDVDTARHELSPASETTGTGTGTGMSSRF